MSPSAVNGFTHSTSKDEYNPVPGYFPDGIKTSGQHAPYYEEIRPYEVFPEKVTGPTVWKAEDYQDKPEQWTHQLTEQEIQEISEAADKFKISGLSLLNISEENFSLPKLSKYLESVREELINGKGFILFKGLPVNEWSRHKTGIAYLGLGAHFGKLISQNGKGHILGHIKDMHEDASMVGKIRSYRTNKGQDFHADYSDIVGLLCLARAKSGGESDIVSTHHVYNTLRQERPDVVKTLIEPIWYFDRKGEVSEGQEQWTRSSVFFLEPEGSKGRVFAKFDPHFFRSPTRFSDAGLIPPLSAAQLDAADVVEAMCTRLQMHMVMHPGEIQFLHNQHILHRRTAYEDWDDDDDDDDNEDEQCSHANENAGVNPRNANGGVDGNGCVANGAEVENGRSAGGDGKDESREGGGDGGMGAGKARKPRRHLMRIWMATPESEGGWTLPFPDRDHPRRGGVQVDERKVVAVLEAE